MGATTNKKENLQQVQNAAKNSQAAMQMAGSQAAGTNKTVNDVALAQSAKGTTTTKSNSAAALQANTVKSAQKQQAMPKAATYTMGTDPGQYKSRWQDSLDNILNQIQNPEQFKYEFNGDELFKSYADLYTQKGKQASLDAMGQAAGLTGGYGNSYAQQVGNQQYQQYLLGLYDKGLDLRDRAYQQYRDDQANLYNIYNSTLGAEQTEYGKYSDAYNAYVNKLERDEATRQFNAQLALQQAQLAEQIRAAQAAEAANAARFAWQQETDARDFDYNSGLDERNYNWNVSQADREYAYKYAMSILQNGQMPSSELLATAGLSYADAQAMLAQAAPAYYTGGSSRGTNNKTDSDNSSRTGNTGLVYATSGGNFYSIDPALRTANQIGRNEVANGNYYIDPDTLPYIDSVANYTQNLLKNMVKKR